jgi:16S rRNA (guanine527-N7)-methyltransferase
METGGEERPPSFEQLPAEAQQRIDALLALLERDAAAPTTVADRVTALHVHVADSLAGLSFGELRQARAICDLGAGAGFPGLVLAVALPEARIDLLESIGRKCEFIERAIAAMELPNARVVCDRAESWGAAGAGGEAGYDLVTARAVARLSTLAELAVPMLAGGGSLLAWKGRRDPDEEAELERASVQLAMTPAEIRWSGPYAGSENRHLHLIRKSGPTPAGIPRRPGMAKKRPRGS